MNLTKQHSDVIKGFAIVFLLFHHLFAFPERIPNGLSIYRLFSTIPLEYKLASYGKVCVSIFVFLTGYSFGLRIIPTTSIPSLILRRITRFLCVFWTNFAVFIPIGILCFPSVRNIYTDAIRFDPSWHVFFQNLIGARTTYADEWWFVRLYIVLIVVGWPLLELVCRQSVRAIVMISILLLELSWSFNSMDDILVYQAVFTSGFIFSRYQLFDRFPIDWLAPRFKLPSVTVGFLLASTALLAIVRSRLNFRYDFFIVPILIPILIGLSSELNLGRAMGFLGRHSAHMWLNHTFFCYYFFGKYFYSIKYPPLILLALLVTSLFAAILTSALSNPLLRGIDQFFLPSPARHPPREILKS